MISSGYLELAHFFAGFDVHQGLRQAFISLAPILKEGYQVLGSVAISVPRDQKDNKSILFDRTRVLWGKDEYVEGNYRQAIEECLSDISKVNDQDSFVSQWNGSEYAFICVGEKKNQSKWYIVRCENKPQQEFMDLLTKFFKKCFVGEEKYNELKRVENLVYIDEVTGLFNQRKLIIDIEESIADYKKNKENFSVLFMDMDHFKRVNDNHGHLIGTRVLKDMGNLLKTAFRENDLLYRYGGDEFVAIIPHVSKDSAFSLGNRILDSVSGHQFSFVNDNGENVDLNLTISIGVAIYPIDASSKRDILAMADMMMYKAKESGRGKVCLANDMV